MSDSNLTPSVIRKFFSSLDCPRSLACWLLYSHGEHTQLLDLEFRPQDYNSFLEARDSLAATSYLSKFPYLDLTVDRKTTALDKFWKAENVCQLTNERVRTVKDCEPELFSATRKIAQILGEFDPEEFVDSSTWGPGATHLLRGHQATATNKFDSDVEITPTCYKFVRNWVSVAYPLISFEGRLRFHNFNKIITVPKNAKTDRVIAIEPSWNLWFQKGVGAMIRRRLKRVGIDLNDQGHNQRLCRLGSKFNNLATIDFSAASDTISSELVLQLLPSRWFNVLYSLRSPLGNIGGDLIEYEKFSSMGNGYTFELESLIFYALACACVPDDQHNLVSIYGDDLIIPSAYYDKCRRLFEFCGFSINLQKSFFDGYYRESCGKHYWAGHDITPLYLKELISNESSVYKAHNAIRRYSSRLYSSGDGCDVRFRGICTFLRSYCKRNLRQIPLMIPDGFGDGGFVVNFDEACPPRLRHGEEGFKIKILIEKPFDHWYDSHGLLLSRLWCTRSSGESHGNIEILPRRTRHKTVKSRVSVWRNLGPWL